MPNHFWILTYLDMEDQVVRSRFDDEDAAIRAWDNCPRPLMLDEIWRLRDSTT